MLPMTGLTQGGRRVWRAALLSALPRRLRNASPGATLFALAVAAVMALPLATIAVLAVGARESVWPHLIRTVLPGALADTGLLLTGVATLTLLFGTGTAWLVSMYRF